MKRVSLRLPEDLLEEVCRISAEKTPSAAVIAAMQDYVRRARARTIQQLRGSGVWAGDLAEMRGETGASRQRKKRGS